MTAPDPACGCGRRMAAWGTLCAECGHARTVDTLRAQSTAGRAGRRVTVLAARDWPIESEFQRRRLDTVVAELAGATAVTTDAGPTLVAFHASPAEHHLAIEWTRQGWPVDDREPHEVLRVDVLCTIDAAVLVARRPQDLTVHEQALQRCRVDVARFGP